MFQNFFYKYLLIVSLIFIYGCSSKNKGIYAEPKAVITLEKLYAQAYLNFANNKYQDAIDLFEEVEKNYSFNTEWASKSLLMRGFIYYEVSRYVESLTILKKFKKRYAGNKNIDYVEYLIAMCLFEQINLIALSQENTLLADRQFKKIILNYPTSKYAEDSKFKLDLIQDQLAGKEMYVARYYTKREKWGPALVRLNKVLKYYETTVYIEEALHRLVEIHYKLGNIPAARKYASILGYNYNDSDWYKKSFNIVENKNLPIKKEKQKKSLKEKFKKIINLQ
jgi:outer membrane protein assembly factor BamD